MSWDVYVFSGQVSSGVVLENDGRMYVSSGGTATDTTVSSHCQVNVERGGFADLTTISNGGWMNVGSGGSADRPILSGGTLYVYSGGTATNVEWTPFSGMLSVSMGAYVTFASKCTGVYYGSNNALVSQADVIENKNLYGWYNDIYVMSGGLAKNTTVGSGAALWIFDGGTASSTVINAHTTAYIFSGGSADDLKANGYGTVIVHSGGTATNLSLGNHYELCIAPGTYIQGTCGENAFEIADGVMSGGTLGSYGEIHVSSGGIAEDVTLYYGSDYSDYYVEMNVHSGGIASNITLKRDSYLRVSSGGRADSTSVESGGCLYVFGGTADHNTVHSRGNLYVYSGAVNDTTVESGGNLCLSSGCRHAGRLTMEQGAYVSAESGSILDFSLVGVAAGTEALVNDLTIIQGNPTYWLTVNDTQSTGEYRLADGAAGFDKTITVKSTSGSELGYLTVGDDPVKIRKKWYSVGVTDGSLTLTVAPIIPENTPDNGWNNYVYDKKRKDAPLNPYRYDLMWNGLYPEIGEVLFDREDSIDKYGKYNFVGKVGGAEDAADFAIIELNAGANLSFDIASTAGGKFVIYQLVTGKDKKGNNTYSMKTIQTTSLKKAKGATEFTAQSKRKLLEAGQYYVAMEGAIAKKGDTEGYYNVLLTDQDNRFFVDGDGGWNNWLYDSKTKTVNDEMWYFMETEIRSGVSNVQMDSESPGHEESSVVWNNFVGFGDDADFAMIYLYSPMSVSFSVKATDAAKFTIWKFTEKEDKKGNIVYTVKSLQTTTLKKEKGATLYTASTKPLMIDRDWNASYFISVQSTNAAKGGSAYYNVEVNQTECTYYTDADYGWNNYLYDKNSKYDPLNYEVYDYNILTVNAETSDIQLEFEVEHEESGVVWRNFVGFGDAADFRGISLTTGATLNFSLKATDATKFTVWQLIEKEDKKGNMTYTQKSLQATTLKKAKGAEFFTAETKALTLTAGTYYLSMESTNASKGASAYYNVELASFTPSGTDADSLAMADALSFASSGSDLLADAAAFDKLASVDNASGWQTVAKLA